MRLDDVRDQSLAASPTSNTGSGLSIKYRSTGGRWDITRAGTNTGLTTINPDNALRLGSFVQDFTSSADDLTNGFTYNAANQVEVLEQSNTQYNYIAAFNRTGVYEPNGLNQYSKVDGQTFAYDATGNLTQDRASDGALTSYTYDMENHLVAVTGTPSATLRYDALGRLSRTVIGSNTTQFLYDGDALVAEYPAYVESNSSYDTWYDGTIVRLEMHHPVLADAARIELDILGPYWDRVYRCTLQDSIAVELSKVQLVDLPDLRRLDLQLLSKDQKLLRIHTDGGGHLAVKFREATIERCMLRVPLERTLEAN